MNTQGGTAAPISARSNYKEVLENFRAMKKEAGADGHVFNTYITVSQRVGQRPDQLQRSEELQTDHQKPGESWRLVLSVVVHLWKAGGPDPTHGGQDHGKSDARRKFRALLQLLILVLGDFPCCKYRCLRKRRG